MRGIKLVSNWCRWWFSLQNTIQRMPKAVELSVDKAKLRGPIIEQPKNSCLSGIRYNLFVLQLFPPAPWFYHSSLRYSPWRQPVASLLGRLPSNPPLPQRGERYHPHRNEKHIVTCDDFTVHTQRAITRNVIRSIIISCEWGGWIYSSTRYTVLSFNFFQMFCFVPLGLFQRTQIF